MINSSKSCGRFGSNPAKSILANLLHLKPFDSEKIYVRIYLSIPIRKIGFKMAKLKRTLGRAGYIAKMYKDKSSYRLAGG